MTPEEIAREAAEEAVTCEGSSSLQTLLVGSYLVTVHGYEHNRDHLREEVEKVALAAIHRALVTVPVPGGLSERQLMAIRVRVGEYRDGRTGDLLFVADQLLAHVDHLTRVLGDCGQDGTAAIWSAGFEAGRAAAQKESGR